MTFSYRCVLAATLLFAPTLSAQLAITEVLLDPVGPNSGKQVVEITNTTNAAFTPKGWQICAPLTYAAIPQIQIPAGGVVQLHINTSGTNTATDFFFSVFRDLGFSDTFLIYKSNNFINSNDIIDFVSWGSGTARIAQAVSVGQWNANNAHVALPLGEGKTISYDGNGDASTDWVAAAPSLGSPTRSPASRPSARVVPVGPAPWAWRPPRVPGWAPPSPPPSATCRRSPPPAPS